MTKVPLVHYHSELDVAYSEASVLNTVDIYQPINAAPPDHSERYWIIFIHGGAWRDPSQTSKSIVAALDDLSPQNYPIAGVASVNYRLSEHGRFPTEPGTPDHVARSATHPTHIQDILEAIAWLQDRYHFGSNYVLSGHSAGGTLAFQAVMGIWSPGGVKEKTFALPVAIVGVCGIYDLPLLLSTHSAVPAYKAFLEGAFSPDQEKWKSASPVAGKFNDTWASGKVAVIAPSKDDELVDFIQAEALSDHLWSQKNQSRRDVVISLSGKHNEIWENGTELAKALKKGLEMLS